MGFIPGIEIANQSSVFEFRNPPASAPTVDPDTWTHVAWVINSTHVTFFLNGTEIGATEHTTGPYVVDLELSFPPENRYNVSIGLAGTAAFEGLIDDVKLWSHALTAAEVRLEYARTVRPFAVAATLVPIYFANGFFSSESWNPALKVVYTLPQDLPLAAVEVPAPVITCSPVTSFFVVFQAFVRFGVTSEIIGAAAQYTAPSPVALDDYGKATALTSDGLVMAVGCPGYSSGVGAVFVYDRPSRSAAFALRVTLQGALAVGAAPLFGSAVSISPSGLLLAVLGPGDDSFKGAVWVYSRPSTASTAWAQDGPKITLPGQVGPAFVLDAAGISRSAISLHDQFLAVGAPMDAGEAGAVFVFTRAAPGSWTLEQKIVGPGTLGTVWPGALGPRQGFAVALFVDPATSRVALVWTAPYDRVNLNAPLTSGSLFLWDRSAAGVWGERFGRATLYGNPLPCSADCAIGSSIAVNTAANAAFLGALTFTGLFTFSLSSRYVTDALPAPSSSPADRFGDAVGLSPGGEVLAVGAPGSANVYVYTWDRSGTIGRADLPAFRVVTKLGDAGSSVALTDFFDLAVGSPAAGVGGLVTVRTLSPMTPRLAVSSTMDVLIYHLPNSIVSPYASCNVTFNGTVNATGFPALHGSALMWASASSSFTASDGSFDNTNFPVDAPPLYATVGLAKTFDNLMILKTPAGPLPVPAYLINFPAIATEPVLTATDVSVLEGASLLAAPPTPVLSQAGRVVGLYVQAGPTPGNVAIKMRFNFTVGGTPLESAWSYVNFTVVILPRALAASPSPAVITEGANTTTLVTVSASAPDDLEISLSPPTAPSGGFARFSSARLGVRGPIMLRPTITADMVNVTYGTGARSLDLSFGISAALSRDGSLAVVGAPRHNASRGAVYLWHRANGSANGWEGLPLLVPPTSENVTNPGFGNGVALSGDSLYLAVASDNLIQGYGPVVWIYTRPSSASTTFSLQARVESAQSGQWCGIPGLSFPSFTPVVLDDTAQVLVVGSYTDECFSGNVTVFHRNGASWSMLQSGGVLSGTGGMAAGYALSLAGDGLTLAVGNAFDGRYGGTGSLTVAARPNATAAFSQTQSIWFNTSDELGGAVALSRDGRVMATAGIVSAIGGVVRVFERATNGTYIYLARLVPPQGAPSYFPNWEMVPSIDMNDDGSVIAIGCPTYGIQNTQPPDGEPGVNRGVTFVWTRAGGTGNWTMHPWGRLRAPSLRYPGASWIYEMTYEGAQVALSGAGDVLLAGAPRAHFDTGRALVYRDLDLPSMASALQNATTVTTAVSLNWLRDGVQTPPTPYTFSCAVAEGALLAGAAAQFTVTVVDDDPPSVTFPLTTPRPLTFGSCTPVPGFAVVNSTNTSNPVASIALTVASGGSLLAPPPLTLPAGAPLLTVCAAPLDLYAPAAGTATIAATPVYSDGRLGVQQNPALTLALAHPAPAVTALTPAAGPCAVATAVTLYGTAFGLTAGNLTNVTQCNSAAWLTPTSLTCTVPAQPTPGVVVTVQVTTLWGGTSVSGGSFEYRPGPNITAVVPDTAPARAGTTVLLLGEFLGLGPADLSAASVAGVNCQGASWINATAVSCPLGLAPGQLTGPASLTLLSGGTTNVGSLFTFLGPDVTAITPPTISPNTPTTITLLGSSFALSPNDTLLAGVAGVNCTSAVVQLSGTMIVCSVTLPANASTAVQVRTSMGGASAVKTGLFQIVTAAAAVGLVSVNPTNASVAGGTTVTLTGTNFGATPGRVTAGGSVPCQPTLWSPVQVVCVLGPTTIIGTLPIVLTTSANVTSNAISFLVSSATVVGGVSPVVAAVAPSFGSALGGTTVSVIGINFGDSAAALLAALVGVNPCARQTWVSASLVRCVTPAGSELAPPVPVTIVTAAGVSPARPLFTYTTPPPRIDGAFPRDLLVAGGTVITLVGAYFVSPAAVQVGGAPCLAAAVLTDSTIRCTTPSQAAALSATPSLAVGPTVLPSPRLFYRDPIVYTFCAPPCGYNGDCSSAPGAAVCQCAPGYDDPPLCTTSLMSAGVVSGVASEDGQVAELYVQLARAPLSSVEVSLALDAASSAEGMAQRLSLPSSAAAAVVLTPSDFGRKALRVAAAADGRRSPPLSAAVLQFVVTSKDAQFHGTILKPAVVLVNDSRPSVVDVRPGVAPLAGGVTLTVRAANLDGLVSVLVDGIPCNVTKQAGGGDSINAIEFTAPLVPSGRPNSYASLTLQNQVSLTAISSSEFAFYTDECPQEGQYGKGQQCWPCPEGGFCPGGYRIWPKPGYWNPGEDSGYVIACDPPEACLGGRRSACLDTYTGFVCGDCVKGYYRSGGRCEPCAKPTFKVIYVICDCIVWMSFAVCCVTIKTRTALSYIFMGVRSLQSIAGIGSAAAGNMPRWAIKVYEFLHLFSGDYSFLTPACGKKIKWSMLFFVSFAYTLALMVPALSFCAVGALVAPEGTAEETYAESKYTKVFYRDRFARVGLMALIFCYLPLTSLAFEALSCKPTSDAASYFMITEPGQACYGGDMIPVVVISCVILLGLTLAFPIWALLRLRRPAVKEQLHAGLSFQARWDVLYEFMNKSNPTFWIVDFPILVIVAAGKSALAPHSITQMAISVVVFSIKLFYILLRRPFRDWITDALQAVMAVVSLIAINMNFFARNNWRSFPKVAAGLGSVIITTTAGQVFAGLVLAIIAAKTAKRGLEAARKTKQEAEEREEREEVPELAPTAEVAEPVPVVEPSVPPALEPAAVEVVSPEPVVGAGIYDLLVGLFSGRIFYNSDGVEEQQQQQEKEVVVVE
jgi:hypothetical protein